MKGIGGVALLALILTASCSWKGAAQSETEIPEGFPLTKGTTWVYQGTIRWTRQATGEVVEKPVIWTMEALATLNRGPVTATVVRGYPLDLAHFKNGKAPGEYLIIRVGRGKYYLVRPQRAKEALDRLRDEGDMLHGLVREEEMFLDLPLAPGKVFGEVAQTTRQDESYCWVVLAKRGVVLKRVKGILPSGSKVQYDLVFRTRPEHQEVDFVPGIGIVRYKYAHHGTVSETEVRLVEFRRGKN